MAVIQKAMEHIRKYFVIYLYVCHVYYLWNQCSVCYVLGRSNVTHAFLVLPCTNFETPSATNTADRFNHPIYVIVFLFQILELYF